MDVAITLNHSKCSEMANECIIYDIINNVLNENESRQQYCDFGDVSINFTSTQRDFILSVTF